MTEATQTPSQLLPSDVLAFAAEQGVTAYLPPVLELTRRVFPHAALRVELQDDPEIADDRHIVITIKAEGLTVTQALEARWRWHGELFTFCPAFLVSIFRLGLEEIR